VTPVNTAIYAKNGISNFEKKFIKNFLENIFSFFFTSSIYRECKKYMAAETETVSDGIINSMLPILLNVH